MAEETRWQKSSYSNENQNCVEVAPRGGAILVRESNDPDVILTTTPEELRAFILGVKAGEFDHRV
jgi:hypothetical protein